jgi:hypothetical protein
MALSNVFFDNKNDEEKEVKKKKEEKMSLFPLKINKYTNLSLVSTHSVLPLPWWAEGKWVGPRAWALFPPNQSL